MSLLKVIEGSKKIEFKTRRITMPIGGRLIPFLLIQQKGSSEVHIFSDFLFDKMGNFCLKNKSYNTKKNFHLSYIIRFLNFIFNDSDTPINKIEDLTLDMVEEFLHKFSTGTLKGDKGDKWRSMSTVKKANYSISHFVYWLWWKREKGTNRRMFKMNHISKGDFNFTTKNTKVKGSSGKYTSRQEEILDYVVEPMMLDLHRYRNKVTDAGTYSISRLIDVARLKDPMITFGIVLGAFAGLRIGDIVQLHAGAIKGVETQNAGCWIDLTDSVRLRSDLVSVGFVKKNRKQPIHEGCSKIIREFYLEHLTTLEEMGLHNNKYGALFLNNNGTAMTEKMYARRFDTLVSSLEQLIKEDVARGVKEAIREDDIMADDKITPHSLRHYYAQLIKKAEQNKLVVKYYLQHESIDTQEVYTKASTQEGIRAIENVIYSEILKGR